MSIEDFTGSKRILPSWSLVYTSWCCLSRMSVGFFSDPLAHSVWILLFSSSILDAFTADICRSLHKYFINSAFCFFPEAPFFLNAGSRFFLNAAFFTATSANCLAKFSKILQEDPRTYRPNVLLISVGVPSTFSGRDVQCSSVKIIEFRRTSENISEHQRNYQQKTLVPGMRRLTMPRLVSFADRISKHV